MSEVLKESTFLLVNLQDILKKKSGGQTPAVGTDSAAGGAAGKAGGAAGATDSPKQEAKKTTFSAWEKELNRRLEANRALDPQTREEEFEIKDAFFEEFFKEMWGEELGSKLIGVGELLQEDLEKFHLSKKNPILVFLYQDYVKKNLLATGLINSETYKILHAAFIKNIIPDSEFLKKNDYNIIYCRDLYTKKDMGKYIDAQSLCLDRKATEYTLSKQEANKRIFAHIKENKATEIKERATEQLNIELRELPKMTAAATKLNSIALVQAILDAIRAGHKITNGPHIKSDKDESTEGKDKASSKAAERDSNKFGGSVAGHTVIKGSEDKVVEDSAGIDKLNELVAWADKPNEIFALLQYIHMNTDNQEAFRLMNEHMKLKTLTIDEIKAGTRALAKYTKGVRMSQAEAKGVVKMLQATLNNKTKKAK